MTENEFSVIERSDCCYDFDSPDGPKCVHGQVAHTCPGCGKHEFHDTCIECDQPTCCVGRLNGAQLCEGCGS